MVDGGLFVTSNLKMIKYRRAHACALRYSTLSEIRYIQDISGALRRELGAALAHAQVTHTCSQMHTSLTLDYYSEERRLRLYTTHAWCMATIGKACCARML